MKKNKKNKSRRYNKLPKIENKKSKNNLLNQSKPKLEKDDSELKEKTEMPKRKSILNNKIKRNDDEDEKVFTDITNEIQAFSGPLKIQFSKNIMNDKPDKYEYYFIDNTFCVFKSINNIFYLIFSTEKKLGSIIFYNLIDNKIMNEIKNAYEMHITNFRHYLDNINKRDLLMSLSEFEDIKIWNINNLELILILKDIYFILYFQQKKNLVQ